MYIGVCIHIYIYIYIYTCVYIYIYIYRERERDARRAAHGAERPAAEGASARQRTRGAGHFPPISALRSISENSSCFLGRDPGTLNSDIVSTKTSTVDLFGFETLKLKIRRLKLWKPTVVLRFRIAESLTQA